LNKSTLISLDFSGFFPNCGDGFGTLWTDELSASRLIADLANVLSSAAFV
jgi:hypothetical protein